LLVDELQERQTKRKEAPKIPIFVIIIIGERRLSFPKGKEMHLIKTVLIRSNSRKG